MGYTLTEYDIVNAVRFVCVANVMRWPSKETVILTKKNDMICEY